MQSSLSLVPIFNVALFRMINVSGIKATLLRAEASRATKGDEGELQIVTKNGDAGRAFSRRQIEIETRRMISFPLFHGHPDKSDLNPTKSDITRIDYSFNGDTLSFQCIVRKIDTALPDIILRMLVMTNVNLPVLLVRATNTIYTYLKGKGGISISRDIPISNTFCLCELPLQNYRIKIIMFKMSP